MRIFINNRNYLTWPKAMAEKFVGEGHEVIFIDNNSTYIPLLDYYETCGVQVVKLGKNMGGHAIWAAGIAQEQKEPFVNSDADYDLSTIPSDWDKVLLEGFEQFPHVTKFGFSWDESKVPPENPAWIEDNFVNHPNGLPQLWGPQVQLPNNWYNYANDSSFALQRPNTPDDITGIRKGRPYTGTHMPWHITLEPSKDPNKRYYLWDDEIAYYFLTCEHSSFTWGRMVKYDVINQYLALHNKTKEWILAEYSAK